MAQTWAVDARPSVPPFESESSPAPFGPRSIAAPLRSRPIAPSRLARDHVPHPAKAPPTYEMFVGAVGSARQAGAI